MTGLAFPISYSRSYASRGSLQWEVSDLEAEAAARELWSDWDRMDGEEQRVLLLEMHRALGAAAACRFEARPK